MTMQYEHLNQEIFPFDKAAAAVVCWPKHPYLISFSDGISYTIVDVDDLPRYLSKLSVECREQLKSEVENAMYILEAAEVNEGDIPPNTVDALVLLEVVRLMENDIHIPEPRTHHEKLERLYQML